MARLRRYATRLALILLAAAAAIPARAQDLPPGFHDRPVLVVDPDRHTARLVRADADAAGRLAVTASEDKTVRVWSLANGALRQTIRLPAGPGFVGRANGVAIDPAGALIAVGGWTAPGPPNPIYLYDAATGALRHRIDGLSGVVNHLAFSRDGRFLAAMVGTRNGLRVFDRDRGWAEAARDTEYGDQSYGAAFAPDGSLATTSFDGLIRLYRPGFALPPRRQRAPGGERPFGIAFRADGARLAVGYDDGTRVDVLDGRSLAPLHAAATGGIDDTLNSVTWGADGTLLAGGRYWVDGTRPVLTWMAEGRAAPRRLRAGLDTVMSLVPLPGGDLLVAAQDPFLARLRPDGAAAWSLPSPLADFRAQRETLAVSADGGVVEFGFLWGGRERTRFDLARLALAAPPPAGAAATAPPRQRGLPIEGWFDTTRPTLGGTPLPLEPFERSRSLAINPAGDRFILGTEWSLRAFDARGSPRWRQPVPGVTWAVNVTGDGRLVVAAYGDGTIRWHRMDDGREILAFMALGSDRGTWVAWTPEGYYAASQGAERILRWHLNQPGHQPAITRPVADIDGFNRPAVIQRVLQERETPRAIGLAAIAEDRERVRVALGARAAPGARLHWLTIGVSQYNERTAGNLRLRFADKDARDLAAVLERGAAGLYASGGFRRVLPNEDATFETILRALDALEKAVTTPDDLVVVHFAGHGVMVNEQLYLLTHEVDARTSVTIRRSGFPAAELRTALERIAQRGRVLLLIDACFSGAAVQGGGAQPVDSRTVTVATQRGSLSVLAAASPSEAARESDAWKNGAFTKAVLDALRGAADDNRDRLISMGELQEYVIGEVVRMTGGGQRPEPLVRTSGTLFAVR